MSENSNKTEKVVRVRNKKGKLLATYPVSDHFPHDTPYNYSKWASNPDNVCVSMEPRNVSRKAVRA